MDASKKRLKIQLNTPQTTFLGYRFSSSPAQPVSVREDFMVQILHYADLVSKFFKFIVRNLEQNNKTLSDFIKLRNVTVVCSIVSSLTI